MNGVHDMGGMHGMGPIAPEPNEPVFHERWEARVYALNRAMGFLGKWNIDAGRHSRERIPPADYLRMSYYEKWLAGLIMLLQESGLATEVELESGRPSPGNCQGCSSTDLREGRRGSCRTRHVRASRQHAAAVCGRGAGAREEDQPDRPHPSAALRTRQFRGRGPHTWRPCLSRYERAFSRREPAASLFRALFGARVVGRGCRGAGRRLYRPLGGLSRTRVIRCPPRSRFLPNRGKPMRSRWRSNCRKPVFSPGPNGQPRSPKSSGRRADAANPMTAPAITTIGSLRSNASSPQKISSRLDPFSRGKEEWAEAYRRTPHGSPVTLEAAPHPSPLAAPSLTLPPERGREGRGKSGEREGPASAEG